MCTSILQCLQADKLRATKFSRLSFISCTYEIIAFFAECSLRYFIKIGGKTSVFERSINESNEKRSELRFCSKSMLSVISCVCNLSSLKINTPVFNFFLMIQLSLKNAINYFSNTRFTCKIISVLYI